MMKVSVLGRYMYPESLELQYLTAFSRLGDVSQVPDPQADVTVVVKHFQYPQNLFGVKVLIFPDAVSRFPNYFDEIKEYFDYVFLCHREDDIIDIDNKKFFHLRFGYSLKYHKPLSVEKKLSVIFIGTAHLGREILTQIPKIHIYGNDWDKYNLKTFPVYGLCKSHLYSMSEIALDHALPSDTTTMRFYEVLATKTLLLTNKYDPMFTPGEDFILYDDIEELKSQIRYYLKNKEEAERIAEQGYDKLIAGKNTYADRARELLSKIHYENTNSIP